MAEAQVGLQFGMDNWKRGITNAAALVKRGLGTAVMTPFEKAVKKATDGAKRRLQGMANFGKAVLSKVFSPIGGALAGLASLAAVQRLLSKSLEAYRKHSDSVTMLHGALRSLGDVDVDAVSRRVDQLGTSIRSALGISRAETNEAFGNMITRGFDEKQARQLTILAANFAKKTGRPIADVARLIGDAANGSADAIKRLGVEIVPTGNAVLDAQAAVLALRNSYGDIGADLANPSERLAAAWNDLYVALGEKISPILEPIIEGISDLVSGLTQTEKGNEMLEKMAYWLSMSVNFISELIKRTAAFVEGTYEGIKALVNFIVAGLAKIAEMGARLIEVLSFGKIDLSGFRATMKEMSSISAEQGMNAGAAAGDAFMRMVADDAGGDMFGLKDIQEAGRKLREDSRAALAEETAAIEGFAGRRAEEAERRRREAEQARQRQERERGVAGNARRVSGMADARGGQQVSVRLIGRRAERFRKARFA
jgi:hypothetical protein